MEYQEDQKEITIIEPMDAKEARQYVARINSTAADLGKLLNELKTREGWKALGYRTFTECLQKEFALSRKRLYELMKAAPIIENFVTLGYKLNSKQANILAQFPEDLRPAIVAITQSQYDGLTESRLRRIGDTLAQAAATGMVNTGDGSETSAFEASVRLENEEAKKRQWEYMNVGVTHISFKTIQELAKRLSTTLAAAELQQLTNLLNAEVQQ